MSEANSNDTSNVNDMYGFPEGTHAFYKNFLPASTGQVGNGLYEDVLATRTAGGWTQQPISAPQGEGPASPPPRVAYLKAAEAASEITFSGDFATAFVNSPFQNPLESPRLDQNTGFNVYELSLGSGAVALSSTGEVGPTTQSMIENPANVFEAVQLGWGSFLVGSAANGGKVFFQTLAKLSTAPGTPAATNTAGDEVYERTEGHTYLVGVLPEGSVPACGADVPGVMSTTETENHYSYGAVAPSGSNLVFSACGGALYLRNTDTQTTVSLPGVSFLARAGTAAGEEEEIFTRGASDEIYEYNVATQQFVEVGVGSLLASSADGTRVYYVGDGGDEGLYLYEHGISTPIPGTQVPNVYGSGFQKGGAIPTAVAVSNLPVATASGGSLLFIAPAKLTAYENAEHYEAYVYSASDKKVICISCNPSGAPATGTAALIDFFYASQGNASFHSQAPPFIANDGMRAVFETTESLVPQDTNEVDDVYEWELVGTNDCTEESVAYSTWIDGCVYLLSSGTGSGFVTEKGVSGSHLVGASENLKDVYIQNAEVLTPGADNASHVYDVREDGGFPYLPASYGCEVGTCKSSGGEALMTSEPQSEELVRAGDLATGMLPPRHARPDVTSRRVELAGALRSCKRVKSKRRRSACRSRARHRYRVNAQTPMRGAGAKGK